MKSKRDRGSAWSPDPLGAHGTDPGEKKERRKEPGAAKDASPEGLTLSPAFPLYHSEIRLSADTKGPAHNNFP
ncbi:hypothetical protein GWI33_010204 [Rhynchophorus ferrugineus]|uniref:Uncharacterized protein n=1 Tax=Rhynchophorus ferrugineus TaxID=354439 RepID=A0A834ISG9_RHYFE|nr:hypothetical protein GWI33_010204 [Rhynchophorus ferrugineus]